MIFSVAIFRKIKNNYVATIQKYEILFFGLQICMIDYMEPKSKYELKL